MLTMLCPDAQLCTVAVLYSILLLLLYIKLISITRKSEYNILYIDRFDNFYKNYRTFDNILTAHNGVHGQYLMVVHERRGGSRQNDGRK